MMFRKVKIFTVASLFVLSFFQTKAQQRSVELSGGVLTNHFHDHQDNTGHFSSSYQSGNGYSFGLMVDSLQADWLRLAIALRLETYSGNINVGNGGNGGRNITEAEIDKSVITLDVYPINFKVLNRVQFNFGLAFSAFISENVNGSSTALRLGQSSPTYDIEDRYSKYNANFSFGLRARAAYDIKVSEQLFISPQYSFYLGLTAEFGQFPTETRSNRNFFGIGVKKNL